MSTTNDWDLLCGFNQEYLSELAVSLYESGKFPHEFKQGIYDLNFDQPTLTLSSQSENVIIFNDSFDGTAATSEIAGSVNIEVDISKVAAAFVNQSTYLQLSGGSTEYADCGTLSSLSSSTGCTFEAWINTSVTTPQNILVFGEAAPGISLAYNSLSLDWGGTNTSTDTTDISDGNWHHVALVVADNAVTFYKDGQAKDTVSLFGGQTQSSSGALQLGYMYGGNSAFSGGIAQVCVWDVALTSDQIQLMMNVQLSGTEDGLVGYWTFADDAVTNLVNNQQGSLNGGAQIASSQEYTSYLYFLDPTDTFTVTTDITVGKTTGDNKNLDAAILAYLLSYAESAHVLGTQDGTSTMLPTTINFITLINATANQLLAVMMTQNRMPPSENPNEAFASDTQILIPSGSNAVVCVWDYIFFDYIVAPALVKVLGVPASEITVTQTEPATLTFKGSAELKNMTVQVLQMSINSQGLYIALQGLILNGLIIMQLQATLNVVVTPDSDSETSSESSSGRLLFSFDSSASESDPGTFTLKAWNPAAQDASSETLTYSLKNVQISLKWNPQNPEVQSCIELFQNLPFMGQCMELCCQQILQLIQNRATSKAEKWSKAVPYNGSSKLYPNDIVFNEGFIVFGTATPGDSSTA
jgi:hypothetical protein